MRRITPRLSSTLAIQTSTRNWSGRARTSRIASRWKSRRCPSISRRRSTPRRLSKTSRRQPPRTASPRKRNSTLFADFNGLPEDFDQRVDFYHHEGNWSNRLILGNSLLVMTSLTEKEGLKGKVQMIYLDPPYGIKFGSNWQVSHPQAQREGRQGRRRHPPARTGPSLPRYLETGYPLLFAVPAGSAGRRPRPVDGDRLDIRTDRGREHAFGKVVAG